MGAKKNNELSDYAATTIRHKARQLVGKAGYTYDDVDDIEQELRIDLTERLPRFDPNRAAQNTFVARLIDHKISKLIRHRTAGNRDHRRIACSINDTITDTNGDSVQRAQSMSQDDMDERMGKRRRTAQEEIELRIDVSVAMSQLTPDDRRIAARLKNESITEAAKSLGMPRSTIYEARNRMRRIFEDAGLREYLK